ncbi:MULTISPECIES: metallophosphoesterase family protein [Microbacterium]|uniref:metallophosphoesterase family protein n=1 Tax=Microbacterium TaxID=33882 RepID=UPI00217DAC16|nr:MULTISPECIES: metallophosphoesterase [Microbacterium]UWF77715.1 metallophosphoesterase [Microbacterium neungamense]WCM55884.1 metallophosphoesterase [Microbacterium sp. EF45047]
MAPRRTLGAISASAALLVTAVISPAAAAAGTDPTAASRVTTERLVWFDGFDGATDPWTVDGAWQRSTLSEVVAAHGTDRRQAFTRASGTIAVAEATDAALAGSLTSSPIAVEGGDELELRFDSHYRARGAAQTGTVTVAFDRGAPVVLRQYAGSDEESAQPRLRVVVPAGAKSMTIRFELRTEGAAGSWMIDDVQVVRPLRPLADDEAPKATVDVFSDIQGATTRMRDLVLPGLRSLPHPADTLVVNGDLVSNGATANYDAYLSAFRAGGGDEYGTVVSTAGNHEFYGWEGSDVYLDRFLDRTGMRGVGGQGGLWGEVLVDGELPLLWIGSEFYDYAAKTGAGPFVELSDEQFAWLEGRLAHWREQGKPVLLFSHHVLPYSVSGTYARFYANDFGADTERFAALVAENPNVVMLNSHTHWSAQLNDWSVEQRPDPVLARGATIVNTAAVTTMYGPSGDWGISPHRRPANAPVRMFRCVVGPSSGRRELR